MTTSADTTELSSLQGGVRPIRKDGVFVRAIKRLLHRVIRKFEAAMGVGAEHMHFIVDTSVRAFLGVMLFRKMSTHREALGSDATHLARIVAVQHSDCGSCVQGNVNMALQAGMRPAWITAALERTPERLPPELREIYEFTNHILDKTYGEDELRASIRRRYGDRALIDLAYAIASAQVFPVIKQALGYAKSCSKVHVVVDDAPRAA